MNLRKLTITLSIILSVFISVGNAQSVYSLAAANLSSNKTNTKINEKLSKLKLDTINVVIAKEQSKEGQSLIAAFGKYWTYSKFKFISYTDFRGRLTTKGMFFFVPMTSPANIPTQSSFSILIGGDGLSMTETGAISLEEGNENLGLAFKNLLYGIDYPYTFSDTCAGYYSLYIACFNNMLLNLQNALEIRKFNDDKTLMLYNNTTLDSLKGKTLIVDMIGANNMFNCLKNNNVITNDAKTYNIDELKSDYSSALGIPIDKIIALGTEDLSKAFESGNKDYMYVLGCPLFNFTPVIFDSNGKKLLYLNIFRYRRLNKKK